MTVPDFVFFFPFLSAAQNAGRAAASVKPRQDASCAGASNAGALQMAAVGPSQTTVADEICHHAEEDFSTRCRPRAQGHG